MLKELIRPFSKGKKNCLSVEEIELEKRVGGGGSVWGRSGRVTVERNEGEVFFFLALLEGNGPAGPMYSG